MENFITSFSALISAIEIVAPFISSLSQNPRNSTSFNRASTCMNQLAYKKHSNHVICNLIHQILLSKLYTMNICYKVFIYLLPWQRAVMANQQSIGSYSKFVKICSAPHSKRMRKRISQSSTLRAAESDYIDCSEQTTFCIHARAAVTERICPCICYSQFGQQRQRSSNVWIIFDERSDVYTCG